MLNFIPIAEANIGTLVASINRVLINPFIVLLFALATFIFIYGLVRYLLAPGNEEVNKTSKQHMLWGIIGMFIMISVFGIMRLILNTLGEKNIRIEQSGDYEIGNMLE